MTDHELTRDVYYPPINKTHCGLTDEQREARERAAGRSARPTKRRERKHGRKR